MNPLSSSISQAGERLVVTSPYSGAPVGDLPYDDATSVEYKLSLARHAQQVWARLPVDERVDRVAAALAYFREHCEEIARDVTLQMGKPLAQSRNELSGFFERAEHMLAIAADALAPDVLPKPGFTRRIEHVPLGMVLDLAAWNYPLLIPVNVVVPALLAGNAVLLKHSRRTPLCGEHFARAFGAMDPPGLVQHLVLDHGATAALVADPQVDHVCFTGSVEGGRDVQRAARERFIDVGLELGGNDPAYVAADADLESTVANVVDGACYNAGQSCCGVERVYVHASRYDEFLERAKRLLAEYRLGDPLDAQTTLGPLASRSALALLESQVAGAVRAGARVLFGGRIVEQRFFEPTLVADVPAGCDLMREESFGPIVPVASVADDGEALARMNDSRYGLTASVWTADAQRAEWFARRLQAGTIYRNRCDYLDPALPWTGVKDSGRGSTLSRYGFLHLTRRKAIHFRD